MKPIDSETLKKIDYVNWVAYREGRDRLTLRGSTERLLSPEYRHLEHSLSSNVFENLIWNDLESVSFLHYNLAPYGLTAEIVKRTRAFAVDFGIIVEGERFEAKEQERLAKEREEEQLRKAKETGNIFL